MSFNCYITAHGYINEEVRIRIPWWHSHDLMKLITFKESRVYHIVSQSSNISISDLELLYNNTLPVEIVEYCQGSGNISATYLIAHELVQELLKRSNEFDHLAVLLEKKKGKYKPYDQFLAEQGQYIKKNHPTIDEDGLKWIYEAWTDYITSDFLEVLYAYIHLKENDQLG